MTGPGTDQVHAWAPLPEGALVHSVQGEIHMMGPEATPIDTFVGWGFSAHVVPVDEMETGLDVQTLWDQTVVKSRDVTTSAGTPIVDFDIDTADTTNEIEPGEMDMNELLGLSVNDKELIAPTLRFVSFAKNRQGGWVAGTPDKYVPTDYVTFRSRRKLKADVPSMALLGISAPVMDDQATSILTPGSVGEWGVLSNMRLAMNQLLLGQLGLMEIGAETPYGDISTFIEELAAPVVLEGTTARFGNASWVPLVVATWHLELPSSSIPGMIDGR